MMMSVQLKTVVLLMELMVAAPTLRRLHRELDREQVHLLMTWVVQACLWVKLLRLHLRESLLHPVGQLPKHGCNLGRMLAASLQTSVRTQLWRWRRQNQW